MWPVAFLHWLFLAVGVGLAWMIVMMFIAVGNVSLWWRESLLYLLVVFAAMWFVHHLRKNVLSGWHRAWPNLDLSDFHQILLAAGTFISLAALYGAMVYPHFRSGYGGGAAWIAEISHREGSILPERLQDELRGAAVIGSSGARLRVVTCSMTDHGPEPRLLEVALDEVVVLRLVRPEALPVFLRSCRTAVSNVVETDL